MTTASYERDFYAWAMQTAQALRGGKISKETGLEESQFPQETPFTLEQALDANFWPD